MNSKSSEQLVCNQTGLVKIPRYPDMLHCISHFSLPIFWLSMETYISNKSSPFKYFVTVTICFSAHQSFNNLW